MQALERARGFRADHVYGATIRSFAARLTARQIAALENDPGTSVAAPHVGGAAALYLSSHSATPAEVEGQLTIDAVATGTKSQDGRDIELVYAGRY